MCGFFGNLGIKSDQVLESLSLMRHRGPDALDFYEEEELFLGHVRLSIIDLDARSNQPMEFNDKFVIVYNGEIYNYKDLRNELIKAGYNFKTQSDTEVILALYDYEGVCMLNRLDGMFAFAIWNKVDKKLFCARDCFGEKPFFYKKATDNFFISSEIKSILHASQDNQYNQEAIKYFLYEQRHIIEPFTFFKNIYSLLPGYYLECDRDCNLKIEQFYNIRNNLKPISIKDVSFNDAAIRFKDLLKSSIESRQIADVNVGSSLSGGIDSSAIVSLLAKQANNSFQTFSVVFPGKPYDESLWVDQVVNHNHVKSNKIETDVVDYIENSRMLAYHQEMPILTSSNYMQWCVSREAKKRLVKVLLDGQGADEYLGGYKDFKYFAIWDIYNSGNYLEYLKELKFFKKNFGHDEKFGKLHMIDFLLNFIGKPRSELRYAKTFKERMLYSIEKELPHLLRYADRSSMAHGVEVRLPFLQKDLVEYTLSLPNEFIYDKGYTKRILREAVKNELPAAVFNRKDKIGFVGPKTEWLSDPVFTSLIPFVYCDLEARDIKPSNDNWLNYSLHCFFNAFDKYVMF